LSSKRRKIWFNHLQFFVFHLTILEALQESAEMEQARESRFNLETKELEKYLKSYNLEIPTEGRFAPDGNCWAKAIAFAVNQTGKHQTDHEEIRATTVDYLLQESNPIRQLVFSEITGKLLTSEEYGRECQFLSKPSTYTSQVSNIGDLLLEAYSEGARKDFIVYKANKTIQVVSNFGGDVHRLAYCTNAFHYYGIQQIPYSEYIKFFLHLLTLGSMGKMLQFSHSTLILTPFLRALVCAAFPSVKLHCYFDDVDCCPYCEHELYEEELVLRLKCRKHHLMHTECAYKWQNGSSIEYLCGQCCWSPQALAFPQEVFHASVYERFDGAEV
jgi:hypothetical protein